LDDITAKLFEVEKIYQHSRIKSYGREEKVTLISGSTARAPKNDNLPQSRNLAGVL